MDEQPDHPAKSVATCTSARRHQACQNSEQEARQFREFAPGQDGQSQQTEILPQKIDKGQQTEASIRELKETNRKTIEELLPAMREPLQRCTNTIDETMLYFEALMGNHKATIRPHLQDAIVLSMMEKHGCKNRKAFEEGLQEIFGDWFELWRSRLYNSFFHTVHENKIPSFGKKRRKRKTKSNGTDAPNVIPNQV